MAIKAGKKGVSPESVDFYGRVKDELPAVTESDNGKILKVSAGKWVADSVPVLPSGGRQGQILTKGETAPIWGDNVFLQKYVLVEEIVLDEATGSVSRTKTPDEDNYDFSDLDIYCEVPAASAAPSLLVTAELNNGSITTVIGNSASTSAIKRGNAYINIFGGIARAQGVAFDIGNIKNVVEYPCEIVNTTTKINGITLTALASATIPAGTKIKLYAKWN